MTTSWRRAVSYTAAWLCGLLCLASVAWMAGALREGSGSPGDTAGLLAGLAGVGLAVGGLWAAVRALREHRTAATIAGELAEAVLAEEGRQYKQLLGGDRQALNARIELRFTRAAEPGAASGGEGGGQAGGGMRDIAAYYRSLSPGRLVVTGSAGDGSADAGTGKTVLAVALILGLTRDRAPGEPVPVRLSASSWPGGSVRDWLVRHLTEAFRLPRREARSVVDANLVLPVVDGLDEMDAAARPGYDSRAARLLRAVEDHPWRGEKAPVVLTCRRPHHEALVAAEAQLQGATRIEIARVAAGDVRSYLRARVGYSARNLARWEPLLDALDASSPPAVPADALDTPWLLTLAAVVYEERDPSSGAFLRDPEDLVRLAGSGELHGYLLDRFVKAAVNAPPEREGRRPRKRPDPAAVWRHLAVLAAYLHGNTATAPRTVAGRRLSGTDIVLHELWPLAGPRRARVVSGLLFVLVLLLFMVPFLLTDSSNSTTDSLAAFSAAWVAVAGTAAYAVAWPQPARLSLRPLTTPSGLRRTATAAVVGGAAGGVGGALFYERLGQSGSGTFPYLAGEIVYWPVVPGWVGFGCLLYLTLGTRHRTAGDPRGALRGDLTACLVSAALIGALESVEILTLPDYQQFFLFRGAALIPTMAILGLVIVIGWGFLLSLKDTVPATRGLRAVLGGPATLRHVSLLLCTRRRLPWRLGKLLHHCYEIGVLRAAGGAYQFRHQELLEHLAARPHPPGLRPDGRSRDHGSGSDL
ncbi:hypothetical protein ACLIYP_03040 [Streptomyces nanhaiensis]|uniref:hypothetical protein n=1 Tax=Streptomyces nanhaiensis TaxID=679319 RepID=UPI00399CBBB6